MLGYTDIVDESVDSDIYILTSIEKTQWNTFYTLYNISSGVSQNVKVDKKLVKEYNVKEGDVLECIFGVKVKYKKNPDEKAKQQFIPTDEYETILSNCVRKNI